MTYALATAERQQNKILKLIHKMDRMTPATEEHRKTRNEYNEESKLYVIQKENKIEDTAKQNINTSTGLHINSTHL